MVIVYLQAKNNTMKYYVLTLCLGFLFFACSNDGSSSGCDEQFVGAAINAGFSNGYDDLPEFMDLETHEYEVRINANGQICSVGYQNPSTYSGGYTIEIINNTTQSIPPYSGTHTFSQTSLQYQTITPVTVTVGDFITVRRTILPGYTNSNQTLGRVFRRTDLSDVPYPVTVGLVQMQGSVFYGAGGPVTNIGQPYIGLGFDVN